MNKQLIIHVAAELLIIGAITVLFNKRVNKLESIILEYDKKYNSLFKKIEYLSEIVSAQNSQIKLLTSKINQHQTTQQLTSQIQQSKVTPEQTTIHQPLQQQFQETFQPHFKQQFHKFQQQFQQQFQPNIVEVEIPLNINPMSGFQNIFSMMTQSQPSINTNKNNNNTPKVTVVDDEEEQKIEEKDMDYQSDEDDSLLVDEALQNFLQKSTENVEITNEEVNNTEVNSHEINDEKSIEN